MKLNEKQSSTQTEWIAPQHDNAKGIAKDCHKFSFNDNEWVTRYRILALCEKERVEGVQEGVEFALQQIINKFGLVYKGELTVEAVYAALEDKFANDIVMIIHNVNNDFSEKCEEIKSSDPLRDFLNRAPR